MRPDLVTNKEVMQALFMVFTGLRYTERNEELIETFAAMRDCGTTCSQAFAALLGVYRELGRSALELAILRAMLPSHVAILDPRAADPARASISWAVIRAGDLENFRLVEPDGASASASHAERLNVPSRHADLLTDA